MKVLVIGASLNPLRVSYRVTQLLADQEYEVIAIGSKEGKIGDVPVQTEISVLNQIDTVTLYINPFIQQEYIDQILALQPRRVIFNPGTENPSFAELLAKNGIPSEESCNLVLLRTGQF